jgi:hypothetical protein
MNDEWTGLPKTESLSTDLRQFSDFLQLWFPSPITLPVTILADILIVLIGIPSVRHS